ncbi:hypothetical protein SAMN05421856_101294 [Chryseobacterium taichungense]|uniref:Uncharacterized protein n=1 Tax=Chryseobacterium taichungense TaxID=295069 RepID=A0A1H7VWN4_9FLAO|nr:hypothetical protein [Chryseobacterium taichungense]SEM13227.1 hypothetical protein SAMN05421856_101294 [Chryseobacterium taichungense]
MNEFFNFSLLVFVTGIFVFFIKRIPKEPRFKVTKIFLISGIALYFIYLIEFLGIVDIYGAFSQNFFYGVSLSLLLLAMKFGIKNPGLKLINIFSFIFNIPVLHQFILIIAGTIGGIKIYHTPSIEKETANYRIESEYSSPGMTRAEDVYFVQKKFPFEQKYKLLSVPKKQYIDSMKFTEIRDSLHIQYIGKELDINTTFSIK